MKKITVIIAGDRGQAEYYARKVGLFENEWRYVNEPRQIAGMVDFNIVYAGQYYRSPMYAISRNKDELEMRSKMKKEKSG